MVYAAQRGVRCGGGEKDLICLYCIEKRLGRYLTIDDFPPVPGNLPVLTSMRMGLEARWKPRSISPTNTHSPAPRVEPPGRTVTVGHAESSRDFHGDESCQSPRSQRNRSATNTCPARWPRSGPLIDGRVQRQHKRAGFPLVFAGIDLSWDECIPPKKPLSGRATSTALWWGSTLRPSRAQSSTCNPRAASIARPSHATECLEFSKPLSYIIKPGFTYGK